MFVNLAHFVVTASPISSAVRLVRLQKQTSLFLFQQKDLLGRTASKFTNIKQYDVCNKSLSI